MKIEHDVEQMVTKAVNSVLAHESSVKELVVELVRELIKDELRFEVKKQLK